MASKVTVTVVDKLPRFTNRLESTLDAGLRELSNDIMQKSRKVAPKEHGDLRSQSWNKKLRRLTYRLEYEMEYAIYQERGYGRHGKFRNYTTPGTGAGFLGPVADKEFRKALTTLKKYMGKA